MAALRHFSEANLRRLTTGNPGRLIQRNQNSESVCFYNCAVMAAMLSQLMQTRAALSYQRSTQAAWIDMPGAGFEPATSCL